MESAAEGPCWYFAYGSNMSPAIFLERRGMRPLATRWGWLAGYRLCFDLPIGPGERGCATVDPAEGARIAGVLYALPTYTAMLELRELLVERGAARGSFA